MKSLGFCDFSIYFGRANSILMPNKNMFLLSEKSCAYVEKMCSLRPVFTMSKEKK